MGWLTVEEAITKAEYREPRPFYKPITIEQAKQVVTDAQERIKTARQELAAKQNDKLRVIIMDFNGEEFTLKDVMSQMEWLDTSTKRGREDKIKKFIRSLRAEFKVTMERGNKYHKTTWVVMPYEK